MTLQRPIPLQKSVEQWLSRLQESVAETLRADIYACIKDIDHGFPYEELVSKVFLNKQKSLFPCCCCFSIHVKYHSLAYYMDILVKLKVVLLNVKMIEEDYKQHQNVLQQQYKNFHHHYHVYNGNHHHNLFYQYINYV